MIADILIFAGMILFILAAIALSLWCLLVISDRWGKPERTATMDDMLNGRNDDE